MFFKNNFTNYFPLPNHTLNKSFKNQIGLADRTGQNVNRWHIWFEFYDGSGMNLNRCDSAKTDQNQ